LLKKLKELKKLTKSSDENKQPSLSPRSLTHSFEFLLMYEQLSLSVPQSFEQLESCIIDLNAKKQYYLDLQNEFPKPEKLQKKKGENVKNRNGTKEKKSESKEQTEDRTIVNNELAEQQSQLFVTNLEDEKEKVEDKELKEEGNEILESSAKESV